MYIETYLFNKKHLTKLPISLKYFVILSRNNYHSYKYCEQMSKHLMTYKQVINTNNCNHVDMKDTSKIFLKAHNKQKFKHKTMYIIYKGCEVIKITHNE